MYGNCFDRKSNYGPAPTAITYHTHIPYHTHLHTCAPSAHQSQHLITSSISSVQKQWQRCRRTYFAVKLSNHLRASVPNGNINHNHIAFVLSRSGKLICSATNCVLLDGKSTVHAEVAALHKLHQLIANHRVEAKHLRSGLRLLSVRVSANKCLRFAKPCKACMVQMSRCVHIRQVAWTLDSTNQHHGLVSEYVNV